MFITSPIGKVFQALYYLNKAHPWVDSFFIVLGSGYKNLLFLSFS